MAFVVERKPGHWEIRESVHTSSGPRARTLATFRTLTDAILDRASAAASRAFDPDEIRAAAWRAGVPVGEPVADQAARRILAEAAAGRLPAPGLRRLLVDRLAGAGPLPELASAGTAPEWAAASLEERGRALWDLLELTDHLPARRRGALRFPRLAVRADD
ncbi:MAG: hypothetical protein ACRDZ3_10935 [Acidimicrobiia bacterium]